MVKHNKRQRHIAKLAEARRNRSEQSNSMNVDTIPDTNLNINDAKQTFKEDAISIKSRSFYMKDSKRTLQRHASQLKQAAEGSKKITDFFNLQTSSENQSEDSEQSGVESAIKSVEQALENPNLANNVKSRLMAIEMYFRHLDDGRKKVDASELVAISLGWAKIYKARCIRSWAKQWIQNRTLPESKRGNHPKMKSLWNHEDVAAQIRSYARFNKVDMTPKKLCEHVNNTILPNIGVENENKTISEKTARRWLKKLGWEAYQSSLNRWIQTPRHYE
nr:13179_t:CDS:2 [Entrophospora candida]